MVLDEVTLASHVIRLTNKCTCSSNDWHKSFSSASGKIHIPFPDVSEPDCCWTLGPQTLDMLRTRVRFRLSQLSSDSSPETAPSRSVPPMS